MAGPSTKPSSARYASPGFNGESSRASTPHYRQHASTPPAERAVELQLSAAVSARLNEGLRKPGAYFWKYRGGDGVVRQIEALADCEGTVLAERRQSHPYGLVGGKHAEPRQMIASTGRPRIAGSFASL